MRKLFLIAGICASFAVLIWPVSARAQAQSIKIEVSGSDDVRSVLNKIGTKPVTLVLEGEKELSGKIYVVTDRVVHITDLAGKEFYDAVVKIDSIQAVIVRAR